MRSKVKKLHFELLLFIALNILLLIVFKVELDDRIVFILKMLTYSSGLILFFLSIRSKGFLKYYASLYILSPFTVILSWMVDGIFGAILGSIFLGIWGPPASITAPEETVKNGNYEIRSSFSGFLAGCCFYTLYEKKFLLFDIKIADFRSNHLPSEFIGFKKYPGRTVIYFKKETPDSTTVQFKWD